MKKYEIMAIIANSVAEKDAEKVAQESIDKRISEMGGKKTFTDFWGAKGFAYKIKKQTWGYYYVVQFEMEAEKTNVMRDELTIDTNVVRFLISSVEKNDPAPMTRKEIEAKHAQQAQEQQIKDAEAADKKAVKVAAAKADAKKEEAPKVAAKPVAKDELDKKLGAIIEDSAADL